MNEQEAFEAWQADPTRENYETWRRALRSPDSLAGAIADASPFPEGVQEEPEPVTTNMGEGGEPVASMVEDAERRFGIGPFGAESPENMKEQVEDDSDVYQPGPEFMQDTGKWIPGGNAKFRGYLQRLAKGGDVKAERTLEERGWT